MADQLSVAEASVTLVAFNPPGVLQGGKASVAKNEEAEKTDSPKEQTVLT